VKHFFLDQNGRFSSALFFRCVWHLVSMVLCGLVLWRNPESASTVLIFGGSMATGEGVQYAWRRHQDRALDVADAMRPLDPSVPTVTLVNEPPPVSNGEPP